MTEKGKKVKDLKGWEYVGSVSSNYSFRKGAGYQIFVSPDKNKIAMVDTSDDDVVMIYNKETQDLEYLHPITKLGMDRVRDLKNSTRG